MVNPLCPVCKVEEETVEHVVWFCPVASRCWEELCINFYTEGSGNTRQLLALFFDNRSIQEIEKFCMVA